MINRNIYPWLAIAALLALEKHHVVEQNVALESRIEKTDNAFLSKLEQDVLEIIEKNPAIIANVSDCYGVSEQLRNKLIEKGYSATRPVGKYNRPGLNEGYNHAFVVVNTASSPIIVDGAYLQFFYLDTVAGLPKVYVGTRENLAKLFIENRDRLHYGTERTMRETEGVTVVGTQDLHTFVMHLYDSSN